MGLKGVSEMALGMDRDLGFRREDSPAQTGGTVGLSSSTIFWVTPDDRRGLEVTGRPYR